MDDWLQRHLACPRDASPLDLRRDRLICAAGHSYPVVDDCPILLVDDAEPTHGYIAQTLEAVGALTRRGTAPAAVHPVATDGTVDAFVQDEIVRTSGNLYTSLKGRLPRYPIPDIRLPDGRGGRLLDVGCNWGRWSLAAARRGYQPIGIDPSLEAVMAARRVARQLGVEAHFVVGDARFLPFSRHAFDVVYSYSVLQQFSKIHARAALRQFSRVLKPGHTVYVQMPNRYGIRQFYQHRKRGFSEGDGFEIRYWTPAELMTTFHDTFGATKMTVDGFFGLGVQASDVDLLPWKYQAVVYSSELLRRLSRIVPALTKLADSVLLEAVNANHAATPA